MLIVNRSIHLVIRSITIANRPIHLDIRSITTANRPIHLDIRSITTVNRPIHLYIRSYPFPLSSKLPILTSYNLIFLKLFDNLSMWLYY